MFLKKYLMPEIFIISKEKYIFMGGRPMPDCPMVNWLFDIVVKSLRSYQMFMETFHFSFVNSFCTTYLILQHRLYTYTQLLLEGCTTGIIFRRLLLFCCMDLLSELPSVFLFLLYCLGLGVA